VQKQCKKKGRWNPAFFSLLYSAACLYKVGTGRARALNTKRSPNQSTYTRGDNG
jgi:hypothetical protein